MREAEQRAEQAVIMLPEYGIQKIKRCADSYRNIAKVFLNFQEESDGNRLKTRKEKLFYRQMQENQSFMAEQFLNMADRLSEVVNQSYQFVSWDEKQYKQLAKYMKKAGIEVKHIYFMENENRDGVLEVTMRTIPGVERVAAADAAELMGTYYDMTLKASSVCPYFVEQEYQSFTFIQKPAYCVLYGQATAIKDGEDMSGDSIMVSDHVDGHMYFMLADGVGSGQPAGRQSEKVLEFVEKFLQAGYSKETAVQVLNGLLLQEGEESGMSTLDICDLNLYKGVCEFNKVGAAASFHKRDHLVEKIWMENLPLGAFQTVDLDVVRRRLEEGDYVIMMTDGILEAMICAGMEEKLTEFISSMTLQNPRDMAKHILKYCIASCKGQIQDDMSVLVFGMWKS